MIHQLANRAGLLHNTTRAQNDKWVEFFLSSTMQGRKRDQERVVIHFQLSSRIPEDNFYRRLKETLDLTFLYEHTKACYGSTGNPSIDPVVFFKFMLIGYVENITSDRKLIEH